MQLKPNNSNGALDFEASKEALYIRSERRAWRVAGGAGALCLLLGGALVGLTPLKTVEPYTISVDKNTGQTEILTVLRDGTQAIPAQRALDEYWISNYIRWREVYDWYTIQHDYDLTLLFSSPQVQTEYQAIFDGEQALDVLWGKRVKATVKILSIVTDPKTQVATVRFEKTIKDTESGNAGKSTVWIATLAYHYKAQDALSVDDRRQNPWGFEVISYRVDPETVQ